MWGRLSRGWSMAQASFAVLRRYPRLMVLPIVSGTILLGFLAAIVLSLMPQFNPIADTALRMWVKLAAFDDWQFYAGLYAMVYVLVTVAIFCNAALIACALRAHQGEEPSLAAGFSMAFARLPQILGWALVVCTVGILLEALQNTLKNWLGFLGEFIGSLFEVGWAVLTYFVTPVLVVEGVGPISAISRSAAILRAKWGESAAGESRFGLVGVLFYLQALAVFFVGLALWRSYEGEPLANAGSLLMGLGALYGLAIVVVLQTLSAIFQAGVYLYATTGRMPATLNADLVTTAFRPKS